MSSPPSLDSLSSAPPPPFVPELGPSLGRLTDPPLGPPAGWVALDTIRLEMVTRVFELAGAARDFAAEGDLTGAVQSLTRRDWLAAWEAAVSAVSEQVIDAAVVRLRAAAAESRLPARRLKELLPHDDEREAATVRLGIAAGDLVESLDALERTVPGAMGARSADAPALVRWREAVLAAARRLESAWIGLESAVEAEERGWRGEIERVRQWHAPRWPAWLASGFILLALTYLGLLIGGYLLVPGPLRGFVSWWWDRM